MSHYLCLQNFLFFELNEKRQILLFRFSPIVANTPFVLFC